MKITVLAERRPFEKRVAASPETVKKWVAMGAHVTVEAGAGLASQFTDEAYQNAGAQVVKGAKSALDGAHLVLKVQAPMTKQDGGEDELSLIPEGAALVAMLNPYMKKDLLPEYNKKKLTTFALELIPRITRAQSMDVLSSQSNLAGYRMVMEAANAFDKAFPMMMTAAGTVAPARILVMGAGVAGLQAIATAKRMGAVVHAFDVRAAAKEQVESLGGTFVEVESDESGDGAGGYAKEMSDDYKKRQADKVLEVLKKSDIVLTTALIPGKPAPRLITSKMLKEMKTGSVVVDLAVETGGNVEGSVLGEVVEKDGVCILGYANMPSRIPTDASALYARNVFNFLSLLMDKDAKTLNVNMDDEIIKGALMTQKGQTLHDAFKE